MSFCTLKHYLLVCVLDLFLEFFIMYTLSNGGGVPGGILSNYYESKASDILLLKCEITQSPKFIAIFSLSFRDRRKLADCLNCWLASLLSSITFYYSSMRRPLFTVNWATLTVPILFDNLPQSVKAPWGTNPPPHFLPRSIF